jgi:hypothetical protein
MGLDTGPFVRNPSAPKKTLSHRGCRPRGCARKRPREAAVTQTLSPNTTVALVEPNLVIRLPNAGHRDGQRRPRLGQGTPAARAGQCLLDSFSTHPARVSARARISAGRPSVFGRSFPLVLVAPRL